MYWLGSSNRWTVLALLILLGVYGVALGVGWPQKATAQRVAAETAPAEAPAQAGHVTAHPPYWMIAPFTILLLTIASLPLVPKLSHWWESNLHKFYVAGGLGLASLVYYLLLWHGPMMAEWPVSQLVAPSPGSLNWSAATTVLANAMLGEFLPFIVLLFCLYTIAGGIRIEGDLPAHPITNGLFLLAGALLASLIGTTGAAMVLVRPLLETNRERKHVAHTAVFFIFMVCNCGGCLLPLGDPPLFLGYLAGVPFLWTLRLWPSWLLVNGLLLGLYLAVDAFWYYPKELPKDIARDEASIQPLRFLGLGLHVPLLAGVVLSVSLLDPSQPFPGTTWHPWIYLREVMQLALVAASLVFGDQRVRQANRFSYDAILEVAVLFTGIFLCMQAPLEILRLEGSALGLHSPAHFFWASGSLSSVLDNAPTYLVFLETARSVAPGPIAGVDERLLAAVSLGSVFLGAMTYIGNGPNFMVKTIAEKAGVPMPSFFGYLVYSGLILLPILALAAIFTL